MRVGVPKEVKADEYRVGMMPVGADQLVRAGHSVVVETQAGVASGFPDEDYARVGATIARSADEVFGHSDMIVKVKEPQPAEIAKFRPGQVVFTYFHLAADPALTQSCLKSGIVAIAYETIKDRKGTLPLLTPMSEVAGKMSIQEGAKYLETPMMGRGILLGGVPGVEPAHVVVLGGGVVGAVLIPGAKAPRLVTRADLKEMKNGAVIVDVAIDQGGCIETARPTTHQQPTYVVDGVVHYCVTNMPGAVGRTSTIALCNATLPYALRIASKGYEKAAAEDPGLGEGINLVGGRVTNG